MKQQITELGKVQPIGGSASVEAGVSSVLTFDIPGPVNQKKIWIMQELSAFLQAFGVAAGGDQGLFGPNTGIFLIPNASNILNDPPDTSTAPADAASRLISLGVQFGAVESSHPKPIMQFTMQPFSGSGSIVWPYGYKLRVIASVADGGFSFAAGSTIQANGFVREITIDDCDCT
jgi:hypothetical protein